MKDKESVMPCNRCLPLPLPAAKDKDGWMDKDGAMEG